MSLFVDRKARLARIWSNQELARIAHHFTGDVINVSAWQDEDKTGKSYRQYFSSAKSYTISNFESKARGWQGGDGEVFLDLQAALPPNLAHKYDVVLNHTTLEHIYDFQTAFSNLCTMSRDVVICVVPFLQQMHGEYGDYWRFTPLALKKMYEDQQLSVIYSSFNNHDNAAIYLFFVGSKHPERWTDKFGNVFSHYSPGHLLEGPQTQVGSRAIRNNLPSRLFFALKSISRGHNRK